MKQFKGHMLMAGLLLCSVLGFSQDDDQQGSNIQNLTPSKLIGKGQWDIKWFNNLYTETEDTFSGDIPRNVFFTSTLDLFRVRKEIQE